MTDLEAFAAWARTRGHYVVEQLIENFRRWCEERRQAEIEAARKAQKEAE